MLSEISQPEKDNYLMISLICGIWWINWFNKQNKDRLTDIEQADSSRGWGQRVEGWSKKGKELVDTDNSVVIVAGEGVRGDGREYKGDKCNEKDTIKINLKKQLSFILVFLHTCSPKCPPDSTSSMFARNSTSNKNARFSLPFKRLVPIFSVSQFTQFPRQKSKIQPCYRAILDLHIQTKSESCRFKLYNVYLIPYDLL